jgi:hypothetical protein
VVGTIARVPRFGAAQAAYDHLVNAVRTQLDRATFAAAWAAGQAMSLEQAKAEVLQAGAITEDR